MVGGVRARHVLRLVRLVTLVAFGVAVGLLMHRLRRTPEQRDLTRYVQVDVPRLVASEQPIHERLQRLTTAPGLKPEEARALLVDEVVPRLIQLRRQAEGLNLETAETRQLNQEYLAATDQLIDACRACVRVIDDPQLPE